MKYDAKIVLAWFKQHGIEAVAEYRFAPPRKWRADFFIAPDILLEVEGAVWTQGRHTRGSGFVKDMEKYNQAAVLGYRILRTTPSEVCMQATVDLIKEALIV